MQPAHASSACGEMHSSSGYTIRNFGATAGDSINSPIDSRNLSNSQVGSGGWCAAGYRSGMATKFHPVKKKLSLFGISQ